MGFPFESDSTFPLPFFVLVRNMSHLSLIPPGQFLTGAVELLSSLQLNMAEQSHRVLPVEAVYHSDTDLSESQN